MKLSSRYFLSETKNANRGLRVSRRQARNELAPNKPVDAETGRAWRVPEHGRLRVVFESQPSPPVEHSVLNATGISAFERLALDSSADGERVTLLRLALTDARLFA